MWKSQWRLKKLKKQNRKSQNLKNTTRWPWRFRPRLHVPSFNQGAGKHASFPAPCFQSFSFENEIFYLVRRLSSTLLRMQTIENAPKTRIRFSRTLSKMEIRFTVFVWTAKRSKAKASSGLAFHPHRSTRPKTELFENNVLTFSIIFFFVCVWTI